MRILFLINSLKHKSGSERVAVGLANRLCLNNSHEITLINRVSTNQNCAYLISDLVNVIALKGNTFDFFIQLKKHISENYYDKIIIHNMGKLTLLCALLPENQRKKMVSLEHVSFISRPSYVRVLCRMLYKKIEQIVVLTNNDSNEFKRIHSNVCVIPNFSPFEISIEGKISSKEIVAIGRLTDQKNYIHLLKAWKIIENNLHDWKLNLYGEGEQKNDLEKFISDTQLKNVYLKGVSSDVSQIYLKSDFFVMSSKYEGLPMVLIEAQSFGLPIVSYDCPFGPSDVVKDGYNGILVKNQNIDQLASGILTLAQSPDLLLKYSANSKENAEKYQAENIVLMWEKMVLKG